MKDGFYVILSENSQYCGAQSKFLQRQAFKYDYEWSSGGKTVQLKDARKLYFKDGEISFTGTGTTKFDHDHDHLTIEESLVRLSEPVYKVGDDIIITGTRFHSTWHNRVTKIRSIDNGIYKFEFCPNAILGIVKGDFRHATTDEIAEASKPKITPEKIKEFKKAIGRFDTWLREFSDGLK